MQPPPRMACACPPPLDTLMSTATCGYGNIFPKCDIAAVDDAYTDVTQQTLQLATQGCVEEDPEPSEVHVHVQLWLRYH